MQESISSNIKQIPIGTTLDVQAIERELNQLWMQNAGDAVADEEGAMLRARVLNLMIYLTAEEAARELDEMLMDIALMHPCRVLVLIGNEGGEDIDIEVTIASRCQLASGAGGQHLCCEEVILRAGGRFTVELPSVSIPLLVSDLPVFLSWRASMNFEGPLFQSLLLAADRIVIDSALSLKPHEDLRSLAQILQRQRKERQGISDLNWSRLTTWRVLLASFYDVPEHLKSLSSLRRVRVCYIAHRAAPDEIAPKALLLVGWLASRLGWQSTTTKSQPITDGGRILSMEKDGQEIVIEFKSSVHQAVEPGGITRVELVVESDTHMSFIAMRTEDCRDLETLEASETETRTKRVLVGADKSEAELLAEELEILTHDRIYEEAVMKAVELLYGK